MNQQAARGRERSLGLAQAEALRFRDFLIDAAQDHADAALFVKRLQ